MFLLVPPHRSQLLKHYRLDNCAFCRHVFRMKFVSLRNDVFFALNLNRFCLSVKVCGHPVLYVTPLCLKSQVISCFKLSICRYEYSAAISPPGQEGTYLFLSQALPSPKQNHKPLLFPATPPSTPKLLPVSLIRSTSRCRRHVRRPPPPLLPPPRHVRPISSVVLDCGCEHGVTRADGAVQVWCGVCVMCGVCDV